jgi:hypothetical protein
MPVKSRRGSSRAMHCAILRSAMSWASVSSSSRSSDKDFSVGVGEKAEDDLAEPGAPDSRPDCRSSWASP